MIIVEPLIFIADTNYLQSGIYHLKMLTTFLHCLFCLYCFLVLFVLVIRYKENNLNEYLAIKYLILKVHCMGPL